MGHVTHDTGKTADDAPHDQMIGCGWNVLDLCCGLGGISLAAQQLGCNIIAGVDTSKVALDTFQHNFPAATAIGESITKRAGLQKCRESLAKFRGKRTVIVSGPPCQGFSVAGPRAKRDPRNRVMSAVCRLICDLQPDAAIIENVSALLAPRHRRHLHTVYNLLRDAGYFVEVFRLNAADFGVAQRRHRMICFAAKEPIDRTELERHLDCQKRPTPTVEQALAGLKSPPVYPGRENPIQLEIPNHMAMRHSRRVMKKIAALRPGTGPMSYRRLHPQQPSRTLISGHRAPPTHFAEPRSITVREAARLQGFPDSFIVCGSFANQMLHVTNAVPPPLARAALATLLSVLGDSA